MSKAEVLAREIYPDWEMTGVPTVDGQEESIVRIQRVAYIKGYHQAEQDLELGWNDIKNILKIYDEVVDMDFCEDIYGEVLKRFKARKKNKLCG